MTGLTKAMLIIAIVFAGVIWLNVVMWRRMRRRCTRWRRGRSRPNRVPTIHP